MEDGFVKVSRRSRHAGVPRGIKPGDLIIKLDDTPVRA